MTTLRPSYCRTAVVVVLTLGLLASAGAIPVPPLPTYYGYFVGPTGLHVGYLQYSCGATKATVFIEGVSSAPDSFPVTSLIGSGTCSLTPEVQASSVLFQTRLGSLVATAESRGFLVLLTDLGAAPVPADASISVFRLDGTYEAYVFSITLFVVRHSGVPL